MLAPAAAARVGVAALAGVAAEAAEPAALFEPEGVFDTDDVEAEAVLFADAAPAFAVSTEEAEAPDEAVVLAFDADAFRDFSGTFFGVVTIVPSSMYEFQDRR
ncbi:hypothetical protein [Thalassospira sp. TSL5-1]|uniref:hypothetical protein n=1 Tax=Thalassospira sp. TSL5-1 TaxID=1544451 RepID=UPI0009406301|nr:hypothetical protein [Thalassospira sp. TSL5-1]OKH87001.1 hypothetical protein LF95_18560 [Thalassospira sp. TSL5-1]